jgi:hypothetical protein
MLRRQTLLFACCRLFFRSVVLLLILTLNSCSSQKHCLDDGFCVEDVSDIGYYLQVAIYVVSLLAIVGCVLGFFYAIVTKAFVRALGILVGSFVAVFVALLVKPGAMSPSESQHELLDAHITAKAVARREARDSTLQIKKEAENERTPSAQLLRARGAESRLKVRRDQLATTRSTLQKEFDTLRFRLARTLPKCVGGAMDVSMCHERYLMNTAESDPVRSDLWRAAQLKTYLATVDKSSAENDEFLREIGNDVWRIERELLVHPDGDFEETRKLARAVASATVFLDAPTTAAARMDRASAEAEIFRDLSVGTLVPPRAPSRVPSLAPKVVTSANESNASAAVNAATASPKLSPEVQP